MDLFSHSWLPFIYLYGVGGTFFLAGMIIVRRAGAIDLRKKRHRFWRNLLIFGLLYFMVIHAFLIIAALYW